MSKARSRRRKALRDTPAQPSESVSFSEVMEMMTGARSGEPLPPAGVLPEGWPPDEMTDADREFIEGKVRSAGWTVSRRPDGSWSVRGPVEFGP